MKVERSDATHISFSASQTLAFDKSEKANRTGILAVNRYNKLKIRALEVFAFAPGAWLTPQEVAERLNFRPRRAVWSYLKRLWNFGLLERRSFGRAALKYKINQRGQSRLDWLRAG